MCLGYEGYTLAGLVLGNKERDDEISLLRFALKEAATPVPSRAFVNPEGKRRSYSCAPTNKPAASHRRTSPPPASKFEPCFKLPQDSLTLSQPQSS